MHEPAMESQETAVPESRALLGWSLPESREDIPSLQWLVTRLRDSRIDWRLLESLVRFEPAHYARRVLVRTDACELLLACWLPGQASLVHDHGGSHGAALLVRGELKETRFAWGGDRLLPALACRAGEGDVMLERPDTIHRVVNPSRHGAVSLHLYAPPMQGMTPYDGQTVPGRTRRLRPPRPPGGGGAGRRRRPRAG
ncbi:cysteine dioxygenase [Myxococcus sp. K15C18031901]|uniref:cysteine dioxygenase n=1 Tax=Myxococcus dinghuensis TaxID=2906761 RepID=UPI0020A82123|nr:cysteine dioxygenase family protein [Myxococcus dinghuensis]MCP3103750.1 cysteine dioxygenase [Myxococcus dinghuensis]